MRIVKSITFEAAHYLADVGDARIPDPYQRMHGHSFTLDIAIDGEVDPATGWVVDFADVVAALEALKGRLDHRLLNSIEGLERPTLENICQWAAWELRPALPGLAEVKVARPSIGESCAYVIPQM